MIVVSGALVVLSIILLVTGLLTRDDLTLIYVSIGSSVLAGIFLVLGALQRRDDKPAGTAAPSQPTPSTSSFERVSTVSVTTAAPAASTAGGGARAVSVVPGRPRFHTSDCRFLAGRPDVETVDVDAATSQGYTECGVCKPMESLGAASSGDTKPALSSEHDVAAEADEALHAEVEREYDDTRRAGASSRGTTTRSTRTAAKAPARSTSRTAAAKAPAKPARTAAKAAPAKAAKAAAKAPAKAAKAAAKPAAAGSVVVIPDRDKFHTDECRFVRDVAGTLTVSKATARRQGYAPCGVCKP